MYYDVYVREKLFRLLVFKGIFLLKSTHHVLGFMRIFIYF